MSACKGVFSAVCSLLCQLGITANYNGFFHAAYAVSLAIQNPNRLRLVTKRLYPEVAKRYVTNWKSVERNIRTVVRIAWDTNPARLEELARHPLYQRPTASGFLAILALHFSE